MVRNKIILLDEIKIEFVGLNSKCYVWRKPDPANHLSNIVPTVKHGGGCSLLWDIYQLQGQDDWLQSKKDECGKVQTFSRVLRAEGLPFLNKTMPQSSGFTATP